MSSLWFLLMADIHVGEAFAIWPPGFRGSLGVKLNLNNGQQYLYDKLNEAREEIIAMTGGHLHAFALVGDGIQGKNKKQEGEYIIEPDLGYQGYAAREIRGGAA